MCSIIGSFSLESFLKLVKFNQARGSFAYSFTVLEIENNKGKIKYNFKDFGLFNDDIIKNYKSNNPNTVEYYIGHVQAPTGGLIKDYDRIHPSTIIGDSETLLWHNGILKDHTIREIQDRYNVYDNIYNWDTQLLHLSIVNEGIPGLVDLEGSFGCIYIINGEVFVFTNDLIELYLDDKLNISSVKFNNSTRIVPNIGFVLDFDKKIIREVCNFHTIKSPYYFGEDNED